jgi:hypothetical protein
VGASRRLYMYGKAARNSETADYRGGMMPTPASDMCTLSSVVVAVLLGAPVRTRSRVRKPSTPAASKPRSINEIPKFLSMTLSNSRA